MDREINPSEENISQKQIKSKFDDLVGMMKSAESRYFYIAEKRKIQEIIDSQGNIDDKADYAEWKLDDLKALMELLDLEENKLGLNFD